MLVKAGCVYVFHMSSRILSIDTSNTSALILEGGWWRKVLPTVNGRHVRTTRQTDLIYLMWFYMRHLCLVSVLPAVDNCQLVLCVEKQLAALTGTSTVLL